MAPAEPLDLIYKGHLHWRVIPGDHAGSSHPSDETLSEASPRETLGGDLDQGVFLIRSLDPLPGVRS